MHLILAITVAWSVFTATPQVGVASWYNDGPGMYAAVHGYRGKPYWVLAEGMVHGHLTGAKVKVLVRDWCQCYIGTIRERIIDLSPTAFGRLAPLGMGLVKVRVTRLP